MLKRMLTTTVFVFSAGAAISATVVGAASLAERVEGHRKADLRGRHPGDIVRVEPRASALALRAAQ